jgi:delta 1-pyrroline-5-carboxylate dehydrogenase
VKKEDGANTSSEDKKIEQPVVMNKVVAEPVEEVKEPITLTADESAY